MAFVFLKEIDCEGVVGEDGADLGEEEGGSDFAVGVDVYDGDLLFYCHGGGAFGSV